MNNHHKNVTKRCKERQLNELKENLFELIEQSAKQVDNLYETNDSPISAKQMTSLQFEWQLKHKINTWTVLLDNWTVTE